MNAHTLEVELPLSLKANLTGWEHLACLQVLLERAADPTLEDDHGTSPLDIIRSSPGNEHVAELMAAYTTTRAE